MSKIAIVGATGSLGSEIFRQAVQAHEVTAVVRSPSKLPAGSSNLAQVQQLDLGSSSPASIAKALAGHETVINAAGHVNDGQSFVDLVARLTAALESLPADERPVCWFLAGAAILEIGQSGRQGVDLPIIKSRYWPHRANYEELMRSTLDWRLLCPGPMVKEPQLEVAELRISVDELPVKMPSWAMHLPGPLLTLAFARLVPQMIVPYGGAAAFILSHLGPENSISRRRIGMALPPGMRGTKDNWRDKRK